MHTPVNQAHRVVRNPVRDLIEFFLPWFDPAKERRRDAVTEAIRRRSISERIRAERVIAQYHQADERRQR